MKGESGANKTRQTENIKSNNRRQYLIMIKPKNKQQQQYKQQKCTYTCEVYWA